MDERSRRLRWRHLTVLFAASAVLAACGEPEAGTTADERTTTVVDAVSTTSGEGTTTVVDAVSPESDVVTTASRGGGDAVATAEVDCTGRSGPAPGQDGALDGTVVALDTNTITDATYRREQLDDGEGPPLTEESTTSEEWPFTTVEVHNWYGHDLGTPFRLYTLGLDLAPGERWLFAVEAFGGVVDGQGIQTGLAIVCHSRPYDEVTAAAWEQSAGPRIVPGAMEPRGTADPSLLAEIEQRRTTWNAQRPDDYTVVVQWSKGTGMGSWFADRCDATGRLRIVVSDGSPVEVLNIDRACTPPEDQLVPTVDQLFDEAAFSAAATSHRIEFDDAWGYPEIVQASDPGLALYAEVTAFAPFAAPTVRNEAVPAALDQGLEMWSEAGIGSYTFELRYEQFNAAYGAYRIRVVDGAPVEIQRTDGEPYDAAVVETLVPLTVPAVFDLLDRTLADGPDAVTAGFHPQLGYPTDAYVDRIANGVDDELGLAIIAFTPS